ncbi:hypothetical protein HRUBRA_00250 [Pseudohaliea rubra DSM 19751]|uniref:Uncharacterized protein n=1 Tax=Pseudohaliea rubra DSM 19751 TaxID=1265313 RepID=A0A095VVK0_9GAMM|nr:hypothetical protein HRUBRA_00250 [Pseudohaliea rubra DSM 19751]
MGALRQWQWRAPGPPRPLSRINVGNAYRARNKALGPSRVNETPARSRGIPLHCPLRSKTVQADGRPGAAPSHACCGRRPATDLYLSNDLQKYTK